LLPYPSPTVAGAAYYASPASPGLDTPNSALSTSHFPIRKLEPESPILLAEALDTDAFEHSPTEFPPRAYPGGPDAKSPWTPVKQTGKIYGSRLEQVSNYYYYFVVLLGSILLYRCPPSKQDSQSWRIN
jgi:hypothetical protein